MRSAPRSRITHAATGIRLESRLQIRWRLTVTRGRVTVASTSWTHHSRGSRRPVRRTSRRVYPRIPWVRRFRAARPPWTATPRGRRSGCWVENLWGGRKGRGRSGL